MGDAILPSTSVPCTSTICVMQYSDKKHMKIYKQEEANKNASNGGNTGSGGFGNSKHNQQQNNSQQQVEYLYAQQELQEMKIPSDFIQVPIENRDINPTPYSRVEIFLDHPLLQYVTIVDTPGVNEKELLNKAVVEFLPYTDAVIIVIDANGGITTGVCNSFIQ